MARRNSLFPRPIQPELINEGDTITVEYPSDGGITVQKTGTVARIRVNGSERHFVTAEGSVIAKYTPGFTSREHFTLNLRVYQHESLFDLERVG